MLLRAERVQVYIELDNCTKYRHNNAQRKVVHEMIPTIRPISELRDTNAISELCHSQQEPVFITKNGYTDLVIMSAAVYEQQSAFLEVYNKLSEAEVQSEAGAQNVNGKEVFAKLRRKYGTATL